MASENIEKCESEYVHPNGEWESVYSNYKAHAISEPRKQYHQPVVFESKDANKLPAREFPYIPCTPHRLACYDIPIEPGLSTPDMKTWK